MANIKTALVATRRWRTGEPSRTAAAELLASAGSVPCLGPVLTPPTWAPTPLYAEGQPSLATARPTGGPAEGRSGAG
jgi:hypothetical protein